MNTFVFAGKGGVGKSTSAASYALHAAQAEPVLIIDYDGGHSISRVLGISNNGELGSNKIHNSGISNLQIARVDRLSFTPIRDTQVSGIDVQKYLSQFSGNYGPLPFHDMITEFFGALTDINTVSYFATLIDLYDSARKQGVDRIIIDVEPTAGLQRLLESTTAMARSFQNLQKLGALTKVFLGKAMPDIRAFLEGEFIQNASSYAPKLEEVGKALREARYSLVCIPEHSPVDQMFDVASLVSGYKGIVGGYIINNIRGESHERDPMEKVLTRAGCKPVVKIDHDEDIHSPNLVTRRNLLRQIGETISACD